MEAYSTSLLANAISKNNCRDCGTSNADSQAMVSDSEATVKQRHLQVSSKLTSDAPRYDMPQD